MGERAFLKEDWQDFANGPKECLTSSKKVWMGKKGNRLMAEEKEESLIQLVLTQDEAVILNASSVLGLQESLGDPSKNAETMKTLLIGAIVLWPGAVKTLAEKMQAVAKATKVYALGELKREFGNETIPR
jgi:hypothetical protein